MAQNQMFAGDSSPLLATELAEGSQVLIHDPFDIRSFAGAVQGFDRFRAEMTAMTAELATAPALARDTYWSFEQPVPLTADSVSPAHRGNQTITQEMMNTTSWHALRQTTQNDPVAAAIATMTVLPRALQALDEETRQQINDLAAAEAELAALLADAATWRALAEDRPAKAFQANANAADSEEAAARLHQQLAASAEVLEQALDAQSAAVRMACRAGIGQASAEIDQLNAAMEALNGGGGGGFGRGGSSAGGSFGVMQEKIALARQLGQSATFKRVIEVAGRFQRIALRTQKHTIDQAREEITGLTTGNDLALVLPAELVFLRHRLLRREFARKFVERQLPQYALTGKENVGRGPIVVMLDGSGSMTSSFNQQTREVWSKAAMLGLMSVATHQKRDLVVVQFSDATKTWRFPKGQASHADMIACIQFFFDGGTDLGQAMNVALAIVDEDTYDKADVICLSDGITAISQDMRERWTARRNDRGMRCYSVLIGTTEGAAVLEQISNEVMILNSGDDTDVLTTIFSV